MRHWPAVRSVFSGTGGAELWTQVATTTLIKLQYCHLRIATDRIVDPAEHD
jgi:hypothetical protein